ncbi:hypothetical protein RB195_017231 [Necator americanus]|uniref:Uncharacterized protein n=1 Tax=Necator americanus TaxID=51031 RepID=A0ABR1C7X8_NECAM
MGGGSEDPYTIQILVLIISAHISPGDFQMETFINLTFRPFDVFGGLGACIRIDVAGPLTQLRCVTELTRVSPRAQPPTHNSSGISTTLRNWLRNWRNVTLTAIGAADCYSLYSKHRPRRYPNHDHHASTSLPDRPPCPSAAQANVQTANSGTDCILTFVCPAGTNAFVWPNGGNTLISYSGTDLVCDGPSGNQWRTDMGLNVESLSCIGPVPVLGCGFCPTFAQVYVDCTMYGRVDCYPDPATIVADIQRNGAQCDLDVQCPYGATLHYIVGGGTPVDTFNALATLSCTMAGGTSTI